MRSTTLLAHLWRVSILAVALLALPQLASAQLPLETKSLKIQATTGTNAVTMTASTVTTPYTLNFPAVQGTNGSFLYMKSSTDGGFAWTNTPSATATTIFWNNTTGDVEWVDPNSANNPNWSRTGNAVGGILGTTAAGQGIDFVTGAAANIRMGITATGEVNIGTNATSGADVTIGNSSNDIVLNGTVDINGATTIDGATVAIDGATSTTINGGTSTGSVTIGGTGAQTVDIATGAAVKTVSIGSTNTTSTTTVNAGSGGVIVNGATTHNGSVTLASTTSPLVARNNNGTASSDGIDGNVLVSAGPATTPRWKNLNDALGIRKAGKISVGGATNINVTAVTGLEASDAIIVTVEGTAGVAASVFSRDVATGAFNVRFSGEYTGEMNYMVIKVY